LNKPKELKVKLQKIDPSTFQNWVSIKKQQLSILHLFSMLSWRGRNKIHSLMRVWSSFDIYRLLLHLILVTAHLWQMLVFVILHDSLVSKNSFLLRIHKLLTGEFDFSVFSQNW
jgi:hypothetical protein